MDSLPVKIKRVLIAYLKTQFIVMVVVASTVWIMLSVIGVRYPLLLGLMTGALATIPTLGMLVSAIIAALVATFDNIRFLPKAPAILEGVVILGAFLLLNLVVDYVLSPYITGKITKVHPLVTLFAVLVGSALFGIIGAFLAVPVLLIVLTVWKHYKK
jgi:predicted PurR-regulated permease PerM